MVRFFHIDDIQPILTIANSRYGVTPNTDADEVAAIYRGARNAGLWQQVLNFVNANPGATESDVAGATGGSDPTRDRQALILLAIMDHLGYVVADA